MKFNSMLLYINDRFPMLSDLQALHQVGRSLYRKGNYLYDIEQDLVEDRFYWMYFQYENENLYSNLVIDTTDDSAKENPRPKNQVEMRNQLFVCFDLQSGKLYISDYGKKGVVNSYIGEMLQSKIYSKNVFTSIDDFLQAVTKLRSVSFTQKDSLFNRAEDSILSKQANIYGLDLPARSKVKLEYSDEPIGKIRNVMRSWKNKHENGEFDEICVVGVDDKGFEKTFDFVSMISSVDINVIKNDNCRYEPSVVKTQLLNTLGGHCGQET